MKLGAVRRMRTHIRLLAGAVRLMRTRIRLLGQPEPMRSIVGATQ